MEKEIEVSSLNRKVKIKEILFLDMINVDTSNKQESTKITLKLGTDLTDEELSKLSIKDGVAITKSINEVNGFADFQTL